MPPDDVITEIQKHDLATFQVVAADAAEVRLAVEYLQGVGRDDMADYLHGLAQSQRILLGPVEGFVAAAIQRENTDHIILSTHYPEYVSVPEKAISLVHEIGATQKFHLNDKINSVYGRNAEKWLVQKGLLAAEKPAMSVPRDQSVKPAGKPAAVSRPVPPANAPRPVPKTMPADPATAKMRLTDILLMKNLITSEQLEDAKEKQLGAQKTLTAVLVDMGFITEDELMAVCSNTYGIELRHLSDETISQVIPRRYSFEFLKRLGILPLRIEDSVMIVAMSNPLDLVALEDFRSMTEEPIRTILVPQSEIDKMIDEIFQGSDAMYNLFQNSPKDMDIVMTSEEDDKDEAQQDDAGKLIKDMEELEGEALPEEPEEVSSLPPAFQALLKENSPTVKLVNLIISDATKARASDIHLEPREKVVEVRYRVDGDLKVILNIPIKFHNRMISRLKILAKLDITEKSKPQDGRIHLVINKYKVDFRVSVIPTFHGEKAVIRVLNSKDTKIELDTLGFQDDEKTQFVAAITQPQGIIFVTGPTGSGKTSTLYSALKYMRNDRINIITLEDPIEFLIDGINQIQINIARGLTFASGLRSILRQDPNIILVGEIRDHETADIAVKASLTGHLVLASIHTNSSLETINRLADIGLEHYQIASSVIMIISQRLVKVVCLHCKEEYDPGNELKEVYKDYIDRYNIKTFYHGKGCSHCNFTGYWGRIAVFEVLSISEKLKDLIAAGAPQEKLRVAAQKNKLRLLVESGMDKVSKGITTLEEVAKHIGTINQHGVEEPVVVPPPVAPVIAPAAPSAQPRAAGQKPKILVVDDEVDIRKILLKTVEAGGYTAISAKNGKEAIEYTYRERPNLIVIDIMMPEMNGYDAVKFLRSSLETATIPIIMLTAKQDKDSELKGLDAGADDYMTKPFDNEKLLARIRMLLRRQRGSL